MSRQRHGDARSGYSVCGVKWRRKLGVAGYRAINSAPLPWLALIH